MKKIIFTGSLAVVLTAGVNMSASAALASDAVLNFDPGFVTDPGSGLHPVESGSYFAIDSNGDGRISSFSERTAISQNEGLIIGQAQPLPPLSIPGAQTFVIDFWNLPELSNSSKEGTHWTSSPANILSDDGAGNVTIDLSGLTLNTAGRNIFLEGTGVAQMVCAIDCSNGDSYTLDYSATLNLNAWFASPGFDVVTPAITVDYALHLEGTVSAVPVPAAVWLFGSGLLGLAGVARRRRPPCRLPVPR